MLSGSRPLSATWILVASWLLALTSCGPKERDKQVSEPLEMDAGEVALKPDPPTCEELIRQASRMNEDAALDGYYQSVAKTQIFAKITPVIYFRAPLAKRSPKEESLRKGLANGYRSWREIKRLLEEHGHNKELLRTVFLTDGYFYEDRSEVASASVKTLTLPDLFEEEEIYLSRRGKVERLRREGAHYVHEGGERAKLLLNDRLSAEKGELESPYHLDLDELRAETLARRIHLLDRLEDGAIVRLRYVDGFETSALVRLHGHRGKVECTTGDRSRLLAARDSSKLFWEWVEALNSASESMVEERPGFDEPADEPEGDQEDGKLRIAWRKAYYRYQPKFKYREEEYRVFDWRGNPIPPQVCIDFIFDTWERSSGNWYKKRGSRPGRGAGYLDFSYIHRFKRHTASVLEFAQVPGRFLERADIPHGDRVPFKKREQFAEALSRNSDLIREGDMMVIHGLREEDMEEHFHTFLVLRTDPMTGMPMVVADNAGRPRIRPVASVMRSAPRRSVKYRLRVSWDWVKGSMMEVWAGRSALPVLDGGVADESCMAKHGY